MEIDGVAHHIHRLGIGKDIGSNDILALVRSGSFTFEAEGKSDTVRENQAVVFRKGVLSRQKVLEPVTMYFFRYDADAPIFETGKIVFQDQERIRSTLALLDRLDKGVYKDEFEHRTALFYDLIHQYQIENNTETPDIIGQAIDQISRTLHSKIDLKKIGAKTELSYVQFIRRFKAATGMTPSDYVTALRLQKAKELLADTSLQVKEIAAACGFENEYYFSNFFKKHLSISPTGFRKFSHE